MNTLNEMDNLLDRELPYRWIEIMSLSYFTIKATFYLSSHFCQKLPKKVMVKRGRFLLKTAEY